MSATFASDVPFKSLQQVALDLFTKMIWNKELNILSNSFRSQCIHRIGDGCLSCRE